MFLTNVTQLIGHSGFQEFFCKETIFLVKKKKNDKIRLSKSSLIPSLSHQP